MFNLTTAEGDQIWVNANNIISMVHNNKKFTHVKTVDGDEIVVREDLNTAKSRWETALNHMRG